MYSIVKFSSNNVFQYYDPVGLRTPIGERAPAAVRQAVSGNGRVPPLVRVHSILHQHQRPQDVVCNLLNYAINTSSCSKNYVQLGCPDQGYT